jgi:hypothetical protein
MVNHAGDLPRTPGGAGEHLLRPRAPPPPAGTLALDQRPCRPLGAKAALLPGRRPSGGPGYGRPHASQARPMPHHPLPVRTDAGRRPRRPRTRAARRPAAPGRGGPPHRATPGPARGQGGGSAADTGACPSGHLDALDTGRVDAGRPLDRLDGHPHGGPDEADRAPTGLAGVRTSSRPATPAGRPDLARVTAPGALGHPRLLRGDGTCAAALTAATTRQLPSTAGMRPRPGALLSLEGIGSRVLPEAMRQRRARQVLVRDGERS